jgi:hypothetical protein
MACLLRHEESSHDTHLFLHAECYAVRSGNGMGCTGVRLQQ